MKKIINSRMYDTERATKVCEHWNGLSKGDFDYMLEELYRKANGEFFIYGEGGARTCYGEPDGDGRCGGAKITPIGEGKARVFLEKYGTDKEWELAKFEDLDLTEIRVMFPETIYRTLEDVAYTEGTTIGNVVERIVTEHYDEIVG